MSSFLGISTIYKILIYKLFSKIFSLFIFIFYR
nr:MAG TPA: hypothetical protein [Crassvirales sp.]